MAGAQWQFNGCSSEYSEYHPSASMPIWSFSSVTPEHGCRHTVNDQSDNASLMCSLNSSVLRIVAFQCTPSFIKPHTNKLPITELGWMWRPQHFGRTLAHPPVGKGFIEPPTHTLDIMSWRSVMLQQYLLQAVVPELLKKFFLQHFLVWSGRDCVKKEGPHNTFLPASTPNSQSFGLYRMGCENIPVSLRPVSSTHVIDITG